LIWTHDASHSIPAAIAPPQKKSGQIFLKLSSRGGGGGGRGGEGALLELLGAMVADISQLAAVGVVMGMLMGYGTKVGRRGR
jgi:hypothetical protein